MKTQRKQTVTLSETETFLMLRVGQSETRGSWCSECGSDVLWVELSPIPELSGFLKLTEKAVVHTAGNRICMRSLQRWIGA